MMKLSIKNNFTYYVYQVRGADHADFVIITVEEAGY